MGTGTLYAAAAVRASVLPVFLFSQGLGVAEETDHLSDVILYGRSNYKKFVRACGWFVPRRRNQNRFTRKLAVTCVHGYSPEQRLYEELRGVWTSLVPNR